jgi:hypothetical protein
VSTVTARCLAVRALRFFERIVTADPGPGPDDIDEIHGSSSAAATGIEAVERIRELICTSASHDPLRDEFFLTIAGRARRGESP